MLGVRCGRKGVKRGPARWRRSLLEAVTADELADDGEYTEIVEDMKEECGKYGAVRTLQIPRPNTTGSDNPPGVGKVCPVPLPPSPPLARTCVCASKCITRSVLHFPCDMLRLQGPSSIVHVHWQLLS